MTVAELIEKLAVLPDQSAQVLVDTSESTEYVPAEAVTTVAVRRTSWQPDLFIPANGPEADTAASVGPELRAIFIG
jgi:hypothetical protein